MTLETQSTDTLVNSCRLLIFCALPKEADAVRKLFDYYDPLIRNVENDPNGYQFGFISHSARRAASVLVALCTPPQYGLTVASATATNVFRTFPKAQLLIVGICGGVPKTDKTPGGVTIGDIIFTNVMGVIQTDSGKLHETHFETVSTSRPPSAELLGYAKSIQQSYQGKKIDLAPYIAKAFSTDQTFIDSNNSMSENPNTPKASLPNVHSGLIGCSHAVLRDPTKRDELHHKFGLIGVEMESSGIGDAAWLNDRQFFVIRSVVDYCDTLKNDQMHCYGAAAAAAFARALIERLPERFLYKSQKQSNSKRLKQSDDKITRESENIHIPAIPELSFESAIESGSEGLGTIQSFVHDALVRFRLKEKPYFELTTRPFTEIEKHLKNLVENNDGSPNTKQAISKTRFDLQRAHQQLSRIAIGVNLILFSQSLNGWFSTIEHRVRVLVAYLDDVNATLSCKPMRHFQGRAFDFFPPSAETQALIYLNEPVIQKFLDEFGIKDEERSILFLTSLAGWDIYDLPDEIKYDQAIPRAVHAFTHKRTHLDTAEAIEQKLDLTNWQLGLH